VYITAGCFAAIFVLSLTITSVLCVFKRRRTNHSLHSSEELVVFEPRSQIVQPIVEFISHRKGD
jgi:hypothetical protein